MKFPIAPELIIVIFFVDINNNFKIYIDYYNLF